jgi:hypothetical protein
MGSIMKSGMTARARIWLAAASAATLAGCSHSDWEGIAMGLNMVADDMAVTLTQVPPYQCGLNAQRNPVCDDTGDGFADRYGDPNYEFVHGWNYGIPTRINDYGEAFQYDTGCDCWRRERSLDTYPK